MNRRDMLVGAATASAAFVSSQSQPNAADIKTHQYAIVELMGFKKLCGRLSQGPLGMWQLEVPVEGGFVVKMINPASVYAITIVDGETVRNVARNVDPLPAIELEVRPVQRSLGWSEREYDDNE